MQLLSTLQARLEELHDVALGLDVNEFVVSEAARRDLPGANLGLVEQLFIAQSAPDTLDLSLYIAPEILQALERDDPHARLHGGNLESFCIALEGVSHFAYVVWRTNSAWPVTPLEMEIQAEVDKFVTAWLLLARQGNRLQDVGMPLLRQLFVGYSLRDELSLDERDRYHTANRIALAFCRKLAQRTPHRDLDVIRAARTFLRQPLSDKLRLA